MKHLNYKILLISAIMSLSLSCLAQQRRERIAQMRMEYISKKLALTQSESDQFWPVYNEYHDKVRSLKREVKQAYWQASASLDEKKAAELVKLEGDSREKEATLYREYSARLRTIIGVRRVALLYIGEEEFRRQVMNTLRERGGRGDADN